ncbi:MAG: hypothetical protein R3324_09315, partial [Halobacteriales archaeon]|nr:hypothetical protein [Halobacteriales archaeon]
LLGSGDHLVTFEITMVLGALTAEPSDVVRIDTFGMASMELDGSEIGLPSGTAIDALTMDGADYLLSLDVTTALGDSTYDDEDLVRWDGASFSLAFDGSVEGVDPSLDLDGAHLLETGSLLLSFDGSASFGGFDSDDEDVLEYRGGGVWELARDGSTAHSELDDTDVDALFADIYLLEVTRSGDGSGTVSSPAGIDCGSDCTEALAPGSEITLTASPDGNSEFDGWTGAPCGESTTCDLTITGDVVVDARFLSAVIFEDDFESGGTLEWSQTVN